MQNTLLFPMEILLRGCPGHWPARRTWKGLVAELGCPSPCPLPTVRAGESHLAMPTPPSRGSPSMPAAMQPCSRKRDGMAQGRGCTGVNGPCKCLHVWWKSGLWASPPGRPHYPSLLLCDLKLHVWQDSLFTHSATIDGMSTTHIPANENYSGPCTHGAYNRQVCFSPPFSGW